MKRTDFYTSVSSWFSIENIFNLYLAIFIFNLINRQFEPFRVDLRFIIILLSLFFCAHGYSSRKLVVFKADYEKKIVVLFFILVFSNIAWLYNGIGLSSNIVLNLFVLITYNILVSLAILWHKDYIDNNVVISTFIISLTISVIGAYLQFVGVALPSLYNYDGISCGVSMVSVIDPNCRYAGYTADPNNLTFLSLLLSCYIIPNKNISKLTKLFSLVISSLGIAIGFSKTLIILFLPIVILTLFIFYLKTRIRFKLFSFIVFLILIIIFLSPIILLLLSNYIASSSMQTRFMLWEAGFELFKMHPILGSGIGSFRLYLDSIVQNGTWITQSHSTFVQLISETGVIGISSFFAVIFYLLRFQRFHVVLCTLLYLTLCINFETVYLPYFTLILVLIPSDNLTKEIL